MKLFKRRPRRRQAAALTQYGLPWLVGAVTLSVAPHMLHVPLWLSALFAATAGWRWHIGGANERLPAVWLRVPLTLMVMIALVASFGTLLGRDAGVALLVAMAAMKLLEARSIRDAIVLIFLSYFLLISYLLYEQTVFTAAYLLVCVTLLFAVQTVVQPQHQALRPKAALRIGALLIVQALPFMLLLFVLFPRIPGPLWGLPRDAHSGLTGLSKNMTPGSISNLIQSSEVAFRVRFNGTAPPASQMYWRGPVLSWLNNGTWSGRDEPLSKKLPYEPLAQAYDYTVVLEPHGQHWLFALDVPATIPAAASGMTRSLQLKRSRPITERLRYRLRSVLQYRQSNELNDQARRRYLQLPPGVNPRARALASDWSRGSPAPEAIVRQALSFFREESFYYTLQPPLLSDNRVDQFLFGSRRGFCEHYSASFVFLMRAAGLPARVVTGYQGGEKNDDYFIVRQSDAHAWSEVWLEDQGWIRVDPTAAVSPARIERGLYAAIDQSELPLLARRDNAFVRQIALRWDALNNAWNAWVLGYNTERQRQFLSNLGFGEVSGRKMMLTLVVAFAVLAAIALGWLVLQRARQQRPDRLGRIYARFCNKLERRGLPRLPHEGPLAFTDRIAGERPEFGPLLGRIGNLYATQRYGGDRDAGAQRELQQLIEQL